MLGARACGNAAVVRIRFSLYPIAGSHPGPSPVTVKVTNADPDKDSKVIYPNY
jgi:hypothetical protein